MAPRAYWKGHVRLALVSFPVRLYAATTSTERITLNRIHRETHERVRIQNVIPDEGPVDREDIVMGYEYDRDRYIPIEEDELEALEVESRHTVDLTRFVNLSDIDPIYFDKPYFMAPDGDLATEAFVTIRDALRAAKKVALGQIVLSKRERIVAIQPCGKGLILETLRWAEEVREADTYFDDIEAVTVSKDQVEMAEALISARSGAFEPETFTDRYQAALKALIEKKLKGKSVAAREKAEPSSSNVINLMDALKASLDDGRRKPAAAAKGKAKAAGSTRRASAGSGPTRKSGTTPRAKSGTAKTAKTAKTTKKTATRQKKSA